MRIAILADVHGNLPALEAVQRDLKETAPDLVVHGGDLVTHGHRPAEVIDLVRAEGWPGVVGNTDEMIWRPERRAGLEKALPQNAPLFRALFDELAPSSRALLLPGQLEWLQKLPLRWQGDGVTLVHATPDSLWRSIQPESTDDELRSVYGVLNTPLAIYCHIHRPHIRHLGALTVCNTGSVGMSFDGDQRASYLLLDNGVPQTRRVVYDVEREIGDLLSSGYACAEWLSQILRTAAFVPVPVKP